MKPKKKTKKQAIIASTPPAPPSIRQVTPTPTAFELSQLASVLDNNALVDPKAAVAKAWGFLQTALDYIEDKRLGPVVDAPAPGAPLATPPPSGWPETEPPGKTSKR